jgi:hypothetical protein
VVWIYLSRELGNVAEREKQHREMNGKYREPFSITAKLIAVWHRDPEVAALAANCIKSMPRRVEALLKAKGGSTKY